MTTRGGRRLGVAAAALAVLVAAGVLAVAIVTAAHRQVEPWGGGAALRPLAVDEGMGDDQAYAVAKSTVWLWVRERNAANIPNVLALTCPEPLPGLLPTDVDLLQTNGRPPVPWEVLGTGAFTRQGGDWTMSVFVGRGDSRFGQVATVRVADGEARLCGLQNAPVPPAK